MDTLIKKGDSQIDYWQNKEKLSYFLAILVFLIHISTFGNYTDLNSDVINVIEYLSDTITLVAVPLFFIVSAATFFRNYSPETCLTKLRSRLHSLVLPFFLWNIIGMLFDMLTTLFLKEYFVGRPPFDFSFEGILLGIFHYQNNRVFWFIFNIICFIAISPVIYKIMRTKTGAFTTLILVYVLFCFDIKIPSCVFFESQSIIYWLVGALIGIHYFPSLCKSNSKCFYLSLCGLVFSIVAILFFSEIRIRVPVLIVFSLSLYWVFAAVSYRIPSRPFMKHSFWVYALHMNVSAVITKLLVLSLPHSECFAIINYVVTIILTLYTIELLTGICKRISPKLYSALSGSR